jgi:hypothetical protein
VIVGLVTALVVLGWRARDEFRRAHVEMAVAEVRALSAELRVKLAEARLKWAERGLEELLRKSMCQRVWLRRYTLRAEESTSHHAWNIIGGRMVMRLAVVVGGRASWNQMEQNPNGLPRHDWPSCAVRKPIIAGSLQSNPTARIC